MPTRKNSIRESAANGDQSRTTPGSQLQYLHECETGLYYLLRKCTPIPRPMDMVACSKLSELVTAENQAKQTWEYSKTDVESAKVLLNIKAQPLSYCILANSRGCEICVTHHTQLPSDPCRGFWCSCARTSCDCPYRSVNPPGCDGSYDSSYSGSGSGSGN